VRLEAAPDPVRVRAAFVSDDDIRDMTTAYSTGIPAAPTDSEAA
jgi:DNA segregation ATPase FtsK/SpoIIIE, S-DNA-T family